MQAVIIVCGRKHNVQWFDHRVKRGECLLCHDSQRSYVDHEINCPTSIELVKN